MFTLIGTSTFVANTLTRLSSVVDNVFLAQELEDLSISITHPSQSAQPLEVNSLRGFVIRHLSSSSNARPLRTLMLEADNDRDWLAPRVGTLHIRPAAQARDSPGYMFADIINFSGYRNTYDDEDNESDESDDENELMYHGGYYPEYGPDDEDSMDDMDPDELEYMVHSFCEAFNVSNPLVYQPDDQPSAF